jgi:hypothetical protein
MPRHVWRAHLTRFIDPWAILGGVYVELSRHSHAGPAATRRAYQFLKPLIDRIVERPLR